MMSLEIAVIGVIDNIDINMNHDDNKIKLNQISI